MKRFIKMAVCAVFVCSSLPVSAHKFGTFTYVETELHYNYWVYLPDEYGKDDRKWPLLMYLHGKGSRGTDPYEVISDGLPMYISNPFLIEHLLGEFNFILISPQVPIDEWYINQYLKDVYDEVMSSYLLVDDSRIYLTGFSMGGFGVYSFATEYPELFAAIAPVAGAGDAYGLYGEVLGITEDTVPADPEVLAGIPIWAFHGDEDESVDIESDIEIVNAIEEWGGDITFTIYPGVHHNSWKRAYSDPALYDWFLQHQKEKPEAKTILEIER